MAARDPLLEIQDLRTWFDTRGGIVKAVDGIDLTVRRGETVALVGESGSGKSTCGMSILRLVRPPGRVHAGHIRFKGTDLLALSDAEMRKIRGRQIAMVFQEASLAFDPTMPIGAQIAETLITHQRVSSHDAWLRATELLEMVEIPEAGRRSHAYAHEFSGGMLQRAMIALAISCEPDLLIADEPTTSLDSTTQAQVLELLGGLGDRLGMAILLVTHSFGIVARYADRAYVMHHGVIVESGNVMDLFSRPSHEYTKQLWSAARRFEGTRSP